MFAEHMRKMVSRFRLTTRDATSAIAPELLSLMRAARQSRLRKRVERILSSRQPPLTARPEEAFDELQGAFSTLAGYQYDRTSAWLRASKRVEAVLPLLADAGDVPRVLDVGAGDGMFGALMQCYGCEVRMADAEDWREARARSIALDVTDVCKELPYEDEHFDLVCSFNTLEHLLAPTDALREMARVSRLGGCIYLDFGPLFASPYGLHAHGTLNMPYPQFLFSDEYMLRKLAEYGMHDLGRERSSLQYTNGWLVLQYMQLWEQSGCEVVSIVEGLCPDYLSLVWRFPEAFSGRGLNYDDLIVDHLTVTLRK